MTVEAFKEALGADVVIPVGPEGALDPTQMLALTHWFNERQKTLRESRDEKANED